MTARLCNLSFQIVIELKEEQRETTVKSEVKSERQSYATMPDDDNVAAYFDI